MSKIKSLIPANNYKSSLVKEPVDDPQGIFKKVIFSNSGRNKTVMAVALRVDDELIAVSKAKRLLRSRLSPVPSETEFRYWFSHKIIKAFFQNSYNEIGTSTGVYYWIAECSKNYFQECFCSRKEIEHFQPLKSQRLISYGDLMKRWMDMDSALLQDELKVIINLCVNAGIIRCITPAGGEASLSKSVGENNYFLNDGGIESAEKKHILLSPKNEAEEPKSNEHKRNNGKRRWQLVHDEVKRRMDNGTGKYAALRELFNENHPSVGKCKTASIFITSYLHAEEKYFTPC